MKKLIELRKCLLNVVAKLIGYNKPIPILNPNSYLERIRQEYNIFDMKASLYQRCFSSLTPVFQIENLFSSDNLNPIPKEIRFIKLTPYQRVFLDELYITKFKFKTHNHPNNITQCKDINGFQSYSIEKFIFNSDCLSLIKIINFSTHKLFLMDNLTKLDLRPYINPHFNGTLDHYYCMNCGYLFHKTKMNPKDQLICSIDCGMKIRGLSYSDFV